MKETFRQIYGILPPEQKHRFYLLFLLITFMAIVDVAGVASIMPFMAVLASPELIEQNEILRAINGSLGHPDKNRFIIYMGGALLTVLVFANAFRAFTSYALMRFAHDCNHLVSKHLLASYLKQPYEWFLQKHGSELAKNILNEVQQVTNGSVLPFLQLLAHVAVAISLMLFLFVIEPKIALAAGIGLGSVYLLLYALVRRYLRRVGESRRQENKARFKVVHDSISGIKAIKAADIESNMLAQYGQHAQKLSDYEVIAHIIGQLPRYVMESFALGGMIVIAMYLVSAEGGVGQALPLISLFAFAGYRLMPALQQIYVQSTLLRYSAPALAAVHRDVQKSLSYDGNHAEGGCQEQLFGLNECLQFDNVSFSFAEQKNAAVDGLSFTLKANSCMALVGTTGSGKSTVLDLMMGLLTPSAGAISVDGKTLNEDTHKQWRHRVGYVPQQVFLTDDDVSANIAFGVPHSDIDHDRVCLAASLADIDDFVTKHLPNGYQTVVGERGVRLSGGQIQRIGIARALYRDPDVLFLDEATSALDTVTERRIIANMRKLGSKTTVVMIAHRLSSVRDCDQILVMENGKLLESGTYDELADSSAIFIASN